jgi:hypothetical protein
MTSVFGLAVMCYISIKLTAVMLIVVPPSAVGAVRALLPRWNAES